MSTSQIRRGSDLVNEEGGEPIQLVRIKPSQQVEVNPQALDLISECDLPVGFVCLAGKYRTGKSFLLNKLLYLERKGVTNSVFSLKSIHQRRLALREFGCGRNQSSMTRKIVIYSFWIQKAVGVSPKMWITIPKFLPSLHSYLLTSFTTASAQSMKNPSTI